MPSPGPTSDAVEAQIDPMSAMHRVVEEALALIPAGDGAAVQLRTEAGFTCACGAGTSAGRAGTVLPRRGTTAGRAMRTRTTVCSSDALIDRRAAPRARLRSAPASMLCSPLEHRDEVFGVLEVSSRAGAAFTAADRRALSRLARVVSTMLGGVFAVSRETAGSRAGDAPRVRRLAAAMRRTQRDADAATAARIQAAIRGGGFDMHGQVIADLQTGETFAVEALARFSPAGGGPERWFADARRLGLGAALEIAAVRCALQRHRELGLAVALTVNVTAETIASPELLGVLQAADPRQIIVELTEHLPVHDYPGVCRHLQKIRAAGIRLAVDDTGAGFSSLDHITQLAPDIIKLDREITHTIDADPVRRYLTEELVRVARRTGARVIAEGIETSAESDTVRALGIGYGQGFHIAAAVPMGEVTLSGAHAV